MFFKKKRKTDKYKPIDEQELRESIKLKLAKRGFVLSKPAEFKIDTKINNGPVGQMDPIDLWFHAGK